MANSQKSAAISSLVLNTNREHHLKRSYKRCFEAEIELVWIHDVYLLNGIEDGLLAGRYKGDLRQHQQQRE